MDVKSALDYLNENMDSLSKTGNQVLGLALDIQDRATNFYIIELSINDHYFAEKGIIYYEFYLEGGHLFSPATIQDSFGSECIDEVVNKLPEILRCVEFHQYGLEHCAFGYEISSGIKSILPDLLMPIGNNLEKFERVARSFILNLNDSKILTPNLN